MLGPDKIVPAALCATAMLAPIAEAAQPAMPGYSPVFRYEDDFSYLADPSKRTDPLDAIKYVPLPIAPGAFVTFGLDDRSSKGFAESTEG